MDFTANMLSLGVRFPNGIESDEDREGLESAKANVF